VRKLQNPACQKLTILIDALYHPDCRATTSEDGGWPSFRSRQDQEDQEDDAIDLAAEIADHLAPGEVCIFQQVGAEKLRYLSASALAVNAAGETLQISIDDIYTLVRERWNLVPSEAKY
jgi:hypothetical protein